MWMYKMQFLMMSMSERIVMTNELIMSIIFLSTFCHYFWVLNMLFWTALDSTLTITSGFNSKFNSLSSFQNRTGFYFFEKFFFFNCITKKSFLMKFL